MMAFTVYSPGEVRKLFTSTSKTRSKYPWRQIAVGNSFFVPQATLPRKSMKNRPTVPPSVLREGIRYKITAVRANDSKELGFLATRTA